MPDIYKFTPEICSEFENHMLQSDFRTICCSLSHDSTSGKREGSPRSPSGLEPWLIRVGTQERGWGKHQRGRPRLRLGRQRSSAGRGAAMASMACEGGSASGGATMASMACMGGCGCRDGGAVSDERRKGWRPVRARSSAPASTPARDLQFHDTTMALDTQIHGARSAASAWRLSRVDSHLHRRDDSGSSSCLAPTPANDGEVGEDPDLEF
jgi:hypothetical protein